MPLVVLVLSVEDATVSGVKQKSRPSVDTRCKRKRRD